MKREADNHVLTCRVPPKRDGMQDGTAPTDGSKIPDGYDTVNRAQPGRERAKVPLYNYYD